MPRILFAVLLTALLLPACGDDTPSSPPPKIVTEAVAYEHEGIALEGYLAYDANAAGKRPGVLVIHEWWGLADHPKERARRLAGQGYVAFCCDMYGKGKLTDSADQAGEWAGVFYGDPHGAGRARVRAGYDVLAADPRVDAGRIAAIGFCYGGSVALELAWSGAPVKGVVCFHGNLLLPPEEDVAGVQAAVLVCNGAADAWVPPAKVNEFTAALAKTAIVHNVKSYDGAVHAFTNAGADARGMDNVKYHKGADEKSWQDMRAFFAQHLD